MLLYGYFTGAEKPTAADPAVGFYDPVPLAVWIGCPSAEGNNARVNDLTLNRFLQHL